MNRSSEFSTTVEFLRSKTQSHLPSDQRTLLSPIEQQHASSSASGRHGGLCNQPSPKSEFAMVATLIHKDLHATSMKLQKLAKLAKRKTLFDDRPVEISELIYIVKQDLAKLNKQIALLQNQVRELCISSSSKQAMEHRSHVVVMLQSRLAAQTSAFKDVLELRTENMKASKDRREQFMFTTQQQTNIFACDSPLYNLDRRSASNSSSPAKDVLSLDLTTPSQEALQQQQQQQLQQVQMVDASNQYLESRSSAIESIETTLQELGGIFQQLAQMVSEQRDMVQRIDANTDDIESNVVGAQTELLKYYSYVSSNRWLMVKVFAVLVSSAVTVAIFS
ncbi:cis-Golgi t-SNARE syntaxin [Modicella reniformis]|uniref:Cis-Golgi t-SNARE syntaxin n=1 Tax=Modicella reniformis TaxID=1440133 RepID=A0A9P6MFI6_9FUNG|nr:cis-Golgi t-SNARE syntaxin [Modicella reniformis]